jgi:hypothetical protein
MAAVKRMEERQGVKSCPICSLDFFLLKMSNNEVRLHIQACIAPIEDDF